MAVAVVARDLGIRTNNVAEYAGLVLALREAERLGAREIDLRLDSKLIVEQLNGRWRVKDVKLQGLFAEASGGWVTSTALERRPRAAGAQPGRGCARQHGARRPVRRGAGHRRGAPPGRRGLSGSLRGTGRGGRARPASAERGYDGAAGAGGTGRPGSGASPGDLPRDSGMSTEQWLGAARAEPWPHHHPSYGVPGAASRMRVDRWRPRQGTWSTSSQSIHSTLLASTYPSTAEPMVGKKWSAADALVEPVALESVADRVLDLGHDAASRPGPAARRAAPPSISAAVRSISVTGSEVTTIQCAGAGDAVHRLRTRSRNISALAKNRGADQRSSTRPGISRASG